MSLIPISSVSKALVPAEEEASTSTNETPWVNADYYKFDSGISTTSIPSLNRLFTPVQTSTPVDSGDEMIHEVVDDDDQANSSLSSDAFRTPEKKPKMFSNLIKTLSLKKRSSEGPLIVPFDFNNVPISPADDVKTNSARKPLTKKESFKLLKQALTPKFIKSMSFKQTERLPQVDSPPKSLNTKRDIILELSKRMNVDVDDGQPSPGDIESARFDSVQGETKLSQIIKHDDYSYVPIVPMPKQESDTEPPMTIIDEMDEYEKEMEDYKKELKQADDEDDDDHNPYEGIVIPTSRKTSKGRIASIGRSMSKKVARSFTNIKNDIFNQESGHNPPIFASKLNKMKSATLPANVTNSVPSFSDEDHDSWDDVLDDMPKDIVGDFLRETEEALLRVLLEKCLKHKSRDKKQRPRGPKLVYFVPLHRAHLMTYLDGIQLSRLNVDQDSDSGTLLDILHTTLSREFIGKFVDKSARIQFECDTGDCLDWRFNLPLVSILDIRRTHPAMAQAVRVVLKTDLNKED